MVSDIILKKWENGLVKIQFALPDELMKKIGLLLIGIGLLFCIFFIKSCFNKNDTISKAVSKEVSSGEGTIINIAELTNFDWEKLYIFKPYDDRAFIQKVVGSKFLKTNELSMGVSESDNFLVFTINNKVVYYFNHPRSNGDFSDISNSVFTPQNAKFKVVREGYSLYRKWMKLKWEKE